MDVPKQNGSTVHKDMKDFNGSDQDTPGKTRVLVHQNALDLPDVPKKESGERPSYLADSKLIQKNCPSETIEPDDMITPLSEESSPTGTSEQWGENKASVEPDDDDPNSFFQTLFPCCGNLIDPSEMSYGRFFGLIICFLFYVGNIASDIAVCYYLFFHGNMLWFALVAAFTFIPTVILNSISYHLSINKMVVKRAIWNQTESTIVSIVIAVLHLTQFGVFARYLGYIFLHELEYLWVVFCSQKKQKSYDHRSGKYVELPYVPYLFIVEAIFQCLPQLVVQLYILIEGQGILSSDTNKMLIISIAVSLLNLSRLLTLCKHIEKNFTVSCCGLIFIYLWFLFTNISRILSFTLFLTKFIWGFTMLCIFHWIIMSLWAVNVLTPSTNCLTWRGCLKNCSKYTKGLLYGIMYILCILELKVTDSPDDFSVPTRYLYAFFYSVIFLENTVVTILWFMYSEKVWYHIPAVILIFISFLIGILFLYMYYRYFHKNIVNHSQRWKWILLFPIKSPV